MLRFCGHDVELAVEAVLDRRPGQPAVFCARDAADGHWLIVEGAGSDRDRTWVCAPASPRAIALVSAGAAAPADAVRHSLTGWVEVVRVVEGHAVPDRRIPCSDLAPGLLTAALAPA